MLSSWQLCCGAPLVLVLSVLCTVTVTQDPGRKCDGEGCAATDEADLLQTKAAAASKESLLLEVRSKKSAVMASPCLECDTCVVGDNPNDQDVQDSTCQVCSPPTSQSWWPCNVPELCVCAGGGPAPAEPTPESTAAPTPATTAATTAAPTDAPTDSPTMPSTTAAAPTTTAAAPTTTLAAPTTTLAAPTTTAAAPTTTAAAPTTTAAAPTSAAPAECAACANGGNCVFASNSACYVVDSETQCGQWPGNIWCGSGGGASPTPASPTPASPTPAGPTPAGPTPAPTTTAAPPATPTPPPTPLPATGDATIDEAIAALNAADADDVFRYETATGGWEPSDLYTWPDMVTAVYNMATVGIGDSKLWLGGDNYLYGLVNVAAFLAQTMQETIRYNACDENNWSDLATSQKYGGAVYPATSACGQLGQSYQDYTCSAEEDALAGGQMACDVDPDMEIRALTRASWYGSPPQLFCAPKSKMPAAPRWDTTKWCPTTEPKVGVTGTLDEYLEYVSGAGECEDYPDQKAGGWTFSGVDCTAEGCGNLPAPNFGQPEARTDVEGCCWWGRGAIQTTGVCNFGKLNFYMGKRAADEGRPSLYPDIDFCQHPDSICSPDAPAELKWVAGFFYWLNAVQTYDSGGWNYIDELKEWVDGGLNRNDNGFIDGASGIVNRGCHNPDCGTGPLHATSERRQNFYSVLDAIGI